MTDYLIKRDPDGHPIIEDYSVRCACGGVKHIHRYVDGTAGHEYCAKCGLDVWW